MSEEFGFTNVGTDGISKIPVETRKDDVVTADEEVKKDQEDILEEKELVKEWYCSTCKETINDLNVMRIGAGDNRSAVFCPTCQRSFGFEDKEMFDKVESFIKNNPTK